MMESDTYLYILEQGGTKEAHRFLLRQGRKKFGEADENIRMMVESITDLERLEWMGES